MFSLVEVRCPLRAWGEQAETHVLRAKFHYADECQGSDQTKAGRGGFVVAEGNDLNSPIQTFREVLW